MDDSRGSKRSKLRVKIVCQGCSLEKRSETNDYTKQGRRSIGRAVWISDGGKASACGNGTRCVADLIAKEKNKKIVNLTTSSGNLKSEIIGENIVSTEMGQPKTKWSEIPLSKELNTINL